MSESIQRTFEVADQTLDGRNLLVRCVPFDKPTVVRDGGGAPYREAFAPGCFRGVEKAPHRVSVFLGSHRPSSVFEDVGHATEFVDRADGLHAVLRIDASVFGDAALEKVKSGAITHVSVGAKNLHSVKRPDGVMVRQKMFLDHLALTASPQYRDAEILAVRVQAVVLTPRLDAWLARVR
jgi:HK97 family phage prohead protease